MDFFLKENVSLWSVSLTMSGIPWADWLGRGHPDKVLPFLTRIYLAVRDKQDSGKQPTDTGPHDRKTTLSFRQVKTTRPRYRSTPFKRAHCDRWQNPITGAFRNFCPRNFGLWIQRSPQPGTSEPAYPLATLSTLAELLWGKQGNSRPVKDKRLFD